MNKNGIKLKKKTINKVHISHEHNNLFLGRKKACTLSF